MTGERTTVGEEAIELLRGMVEDPIACRSRRADPAPQAGCDCWACELMRKASNLVDGWDEASEYR